MRRGGWVSPSLCLPSQDIGQKEWDVFCSSWLAVPFVPYVGKPNMDESRRILDAEASTIIKKICSVDQCADIRNLEEDKRDRLIKALKDEGLYPLFTGLLYLDVIN